MKNVHHPDKFLQVSLGLIALAHPDYYPIPFKVNFKCINGVKLMKLWVELPWAQIKPKKKGKNWLILSSTSFLIHYKDVNIPLGKEILTIESKWFLWFQLRKLSLVESPKVCSFLQRTGNMWYSEIKSIFYFIFSEKEINFPILDYSAFNLMFNL